MPHQLTDVLVEEPEADEKKKKEVGLRKKRKTEKKMNCGILSASFIKPICIEIT